LRNLPEVRHLPRDADALVSADCAPKGGGVLQSA
jgi:hypothetical protein